MHCSGSVIILLDFLSARGFDQNVLCLSKSSEIAPKNRVKVITKNYDVIHHLADRHKA
jgi:hypothetical protein